jgi:hypothetical protein
MPSGAFRWRFFHDCGVEERFSSPSQPWGVSVVTEPVVCLKNCEILTEIQISSLCFHAVLATSPLKPFPCWRITGAWRSRCAPQCPRAERLPDEAGSTNERIGELSAGSSGNRTGVSAILFRWIKPSRFSRKFFFTQKQASRVQEI